jgi:hypothetical protein
LPAVRQKRQSTCAQSELREEFNGNGKATISSKEKYSEGSGQCEAEADHRPSAQSDTNSSRQASVKSCQAPPIIEVVKLIGAQPHLAKWFFGPDGKPAK